MQRKKSISFNDLGLTTPLPITLAKSREQRHLEKLEGKKQKKLLVKEATACVSSLRTDVEKHKAFISTEFKNEKDEKEKRKKKLQAEHIKARNERETKKERDALSIEAQHKYISEIMEMQREDNTRMRQVQLLLEKAQEKSIKEAIANVHIPVIRSKIIEEQRARLPVLREEQPIIEAINNATRTCVLICGETGSGKTTQIPQFLWETGYGHAESQAFGREGCILVTEPRRVAAVSMAQRVAEELNQPFGQEVCYHVRYNNNLSDTCRLKFATEGIVLKEIQSDFLLTQYSVIVVDEAHERSISCDILVGLLSRIVPLRNDLFHEELEANGRDASKTKIKPLRLVIMSATMRVQDFRDNRVLFPIVPPLINVEARLFPVTNHFARKTILIDYVQQSFEKVCQIHKKLPPGGILVFLCTQHEIEDLCACLREHYAKTKVEYNEHTYNKHAFLRGTSGGFPKMLEQDDASSSASVDGTIPDGDVTNEKTQDEYGLFIDEYALDEDESTGGDTPGGISEATMSENKFKRPRKAGTTSNFKIEEEDEPNGKFDTLHVLPLYALLDLKKQHEVFKAPPPGKRLCVVATNVAETSITIPNIKYVVDAGRAKTKVIDEETKASCFSIEWISQASAEQRSGRAGRVGPGHCYRLYSTAVYSNLMAKYGTPEILRTPLDSVVLLMKHIGIDHVGAFAFPSPPRLDDLKGALSHLTLLEALDGSNGYRITPLGRKLIAYPIPPRFARAVVEAQSMQLSQKLLGMVLLIVAVCATTTHIFTGEGNQIKASKKDEGDPRRERIRSLLNHGSDLLTYLNAFHVYMQNPKNCHTYCLVDKSMHESKMLFRQLRNLVEENSTAEGDLMDSLDTNETWYIGNTAGCTTERVQITKDDEIALRQVFIPGLLDQVARRATVHECRSMNVEYTDRKTSATPYLVTSTHSIVYINPTSSVSRTYPAPEYVTYTALQKVVRSETKKAQACMLGVTVVTKEWLNLYDYSE
ncbi:unnamed protein product [Phytomonas sp. Hart1]|nr:unnamed protein product [Phytomonas sp. Hart1]|eukprot:CCW68171.1 unnamed protein product [Phytomonas sp. isolate Hart1]